MLLPNIDWGLVEVTAFGDENNELLLELPPNMPPDDVPPPNTFFEAESEEGVEPRPLKNPPPPNILPVVADAPGLVSAFPPNIELVVDDAAAVPELAGV